MEELKEKVVEELQKFVDSMKEIDEIDELAIRVMFKDKENGNFGNAVGGIAMHDEVNDFDNIDDTIYDYLKLDEYSEEEE